jgi:hypothetical protein
MILGCHWKLKTTRQLQLNITRAVDFVENLRVVVLLSLQLFHIMLQLEQHVKDILLKICQYRIICGLYTNLMQ